jgi:hypothetical protein
MDMQSCKNKKINLGLVVIVIVLDKKDHSSSRNCDWDEVETNYARTNPQTKLNWWCENQIIIIIIIIEANKVYKIIKLPGIRQDYEAQTPTRIPDTIQTLIRRHR